MSLSSAVELNDTAAAMLEVAIMATAPGLSSSSSSSFHPNTTSADDDAAARLEQILDPRDIFRAAIVHLQTSVRAEAEAERRALADMRINNMANGNASDSSNMAYASTATPSLLSTATSSTGDNNNNHPDVPHAEVLQARQRLERARQVVVNITQQRFGHSNHTGSSGSANTNTITNAASSSLVRRLYNLPIKVGDTASANANVHTTTSSPSSSADTTAGVLNHQHRRPQSESISGIVLYNFAISHQMLGLRRLQASEPAHVSASTHDDATASAIAYFRKACALYDMSLQVLEADVVRQIDAAEAMERRARNGECDARTTDRSSGDGSGDQHDHGSGDQGGADISGGAMAVDAPASSASPPSPSTSSFTATATASSHHVGPSLEQLTLLCAAACLHNSAALLAYIHRNTNGDDDNDNDEVQDIQSRSTSVLTLCNVQRTLTLLQQVPSPCTNRGDIEEAWNLFFFAALDIPLVELANAA